MQKIKQFPWFRPMGPFPKHPDWDANAVTFGLSGQAKINVLYLFVLTNIESELTGAFDIEEDEEKEHRGRGNKPKFVWRQVAGLHAEATLHLVSEEGTPDCSKGG